MANSPESNEPVAWWNGRETVWFEHELMGTNPPIENPIPLYTWDDSGQHCANAIRSRNA